MNPVLPMLPMTPQSLCLGRRGAALPFRTETDAQLRANVLESLLWEPEANALRIVVQVERGVVTLLGRAQDQASVAAAVRAARRVPGVAAVRHAMAVQPLWGRDARHAVTSEPPASSACCPQGECAGLAAPPVRGPR